jgi:hypothetical protein
MFFISKMYEVSTLLALAGASSGCVLDHEQGRLGEGSEELVEDSYCQSQLICEPIPICGDGICQSGESGVCDEDCWVPPPPYIHWSNWLNRDNPTGAGDWETLADFAISQVGCSLPAYVEATTLSGVSWNSTGEQLTVSPDVGLICRNEYQPDGYCLDYRVRFGCTTLDWTALPQSWHENYTLETGSIEGLVPASVSVPGSHYLDAMSFGSNGSFSTLRPSPNDLPYWAYGTWTRSSNVITVNFYDPRLNSNIQEHYQVAELTATLFRFRRI